MKAFCVSSYDTAAEVCGNFFFPRGATTRGGDEKEKVCNAVLRGSSKKITGKNKGIKRGSN